MYDKLHDYTPLEACSDYRMTIFSCSFLPSPVLGYIAVWKNYFLDD